MPVAPRRLFKSLSSYFDAYTLLLLFHSLVDMMGMGLGLLADIMIVFRIILIIIFSFLVQFIMQI